MPFDCFYWEFVYAINIFGLNMDSTKRIKFSIELVGYLLCLMGFLLVIFTFYPGYMSEDSIAQLAQGRSWHFVDGHPPVMAAVWGLIDKVIAGPFGMLLLHNILFWGGAAIFWRLTNRKSLRLGLALVLFGLMPPVLALLSTIWKDVGLGASLFLASALLYTSLKSNSKGALFATFPLLFYGYSVRHNAAPAVLPLAVWTGFIACRISPLLKAKSTKIRILPAMLGLVYFGILTATMLTVTKLLLKGSNHYLEQYVLLHDLAAISTAKGEVLFPEYVINESIFSLEKVRANYHPAFATPLRAVSGLRLSDKPHHIAALRAKWWDTILDNKVLYLNHRWAAFEQLIGFKTDYVCLPYQSVMHPNSFGYKVNDWKVQQYVRPYLFYFKESLLFRNVLWLLISLGLIYFSLRGRLRGDLEIVFVLAMSGALFGLSYFFYAPSCDFRYLWWTMIAANVALIFFIDSAVILWRRSG